MCCCERKIVWILFCTLISNSAYALIAPFLPLEFKDKGISGQLIGLMFAIYSVAVIRCSPLVGKAIQCVGNTNMISLGILVMGLAFVCFGLIEALETEAMVLTVGFTLRFIQGASSAFVQTTCYSIATNDFPEKKEQIVGWVEALTGLGLILGPIIGSCLYGLLGYSQTFYIYGSFLIFLAFIIRINFPDDSEVEGNSPALNINDDNFTQQESNQHLYGDELSSFRNDVTPEKIYPISSNQDDCDDEETGSDSGASQQVSIGKLLCNARFTMAAMASSLVYFCYSFMEPILAERLTDFDLNAMQIGLFFAIYAIFYIPASVAV